MNRKTAYAIIVLLVIVNISLIAVNAIPAAKHQPKHYNAYASTSPQIITGQGTAPTNTNQTDSGTG